MAASLIRSLLLASAASVAAPQAFAQVAPAPVATVTAGKRVYTAADFARFAPKTAYDMLAQVPSFSIRSADQERGLGQASENVLINGQRVANKSGGAVDQAQRTSATNVDRIEVLDAASLGIAGLSGQVANIILKSTAKGGSGQYEWYVNWRSHFAEPEFLGGSISYSNKVGPVDYTISVKNGSGRGALGGPVRLYDRNHVLIETRTESTHSEYEQISSQLKLGIDGPGSSIGNLTLGYTPYTNPNQLKDTRILATGERRHREYSGSLAGYYADINGDYEFALGPGRLKLIGVGAMASPAVRTRRHARLPPCRQCDARRRPEGRA